MARQEVSKVPSGRVKRTPITVRNRLSVKDQDPNYVYRIVNITDADGHPTNKLEARLEQGYEIVENSKIGDRRVDLPSSLGSAGETSVGRGAKAITMRIPREYYEEDQAMKQASIDDLENTMNAEAIKRKTA